MTDAGTLDRLEREVEHARARLADDLARLRDPSTIARAKSELKTQATHYKDRIVSSAKESAAQQGDGWRDALMDKARENPTAVAAIAAGLGWHLYKHPPITLLLVGGGLASLFAGRGDEHRPVDDGFMGRVQGFNRTTHQMTETASEWMEEAKEATYEMADDARKLSEQASAQMTTLSQQMSDALLDYADDRRELIRENPITMTIAAMALGAALGVTMRKRM
jgi:ElaB/YqjD/DUF883 family membrane-anchored ribosome-binding protein